MAVAENHEPFNFHISLQCSTFSATEQVLEGARHMVAMQIARDPLVRQCVRQTFYERAKITVIPTKKGRKVSPASTLWMDGNFLQLVKKLFSLQFLPKFMMFWPNGICHPILKFRINFTGQEKNK